MLDGYLGIRLPNQTMTCRAYLCPFCRYCIIIVTQGFFRVLGRCFCDWDFSYARPIEEHQRVTSDSPPLIMLLLFDIIEPLGSSSLV